MFDTLLRFFRVVADSLTLTQTENKPGLKIHKSGAGAGNAFEVENDGTGIGVLVNQDGAAYGVDIDQAGAESALRVSQSANDIGVEVVKSGTGAGTAASIANAGTGTALAVVQTGNGLPVSITADDAGLTILRFLSAVGASLTFRTKRAVLDLSAAKSTTGGFIPAGCYLLGLTAKVLTALSGDATFDASTWRLGQTGGDVDRWGNALALAAGTAAGSAAATAEPSGWFTAADEVDFLETAGTADTGTIEIEIFYYDYSAAA